MVAKVPPATYARTKNAVGTHHDAGVKCLTPSASARKSQQKTAAPVNLQRSQKLSTSAARRGREARAAPSRTRSGSWIRVAVNATALLVAPSPQPIAVSRLGPSGAVRGSATIPVPLLAMVRSPLTTNPFPETVFVAGRVIQGNLGSHPVEITVRNWVGRGKSDPMSRILCIVRSLPDRRPATDSAATQARRRTLLASHHWCRGIQHGIPPPMAAGQRERRRGLRAATRTGDVGTLGTEADRSGGGAAGCARARCSVRNR